MSERRSFKRFSLKYFFELHDKINQVFEILKQTEHSTANTRSSTCNYIYFYDLKRYIKEWYILSQY